MQLTEISLAAFLCLAGIRCLSYIPQIIRVARDEHGASAISYTTWLSWTFANLATAAYAGLNLNDGYLAGVSCIYAFCCAVVILLTAVKRFRHRNRLLPTALHPRNEVVSISPRALERRGASRDAYRLSCEHTQRLGPLPHGAVAGSIVSSTAA